MNDGLSITALFILTTSMKCTPIISLELKDNAFHWKSFGRNHAIHLFHWNSIGEMHLITRTWNISVGFRLSGGAFYSSIATIGTIDTNGLTLIYSISILLVKCISLRGLKIILLASGWVGVHSTRPLARLVRLVPME